MREKLLKLMKSEKLSSSRLAEILEIQPSSISHILSVRNNPSHRYLHKSQRPFPTLNPDWLLLDAEQMYRSNEELNRRINDTNTQSSQTTGSAEKMIVNSKIALNPKNESSQNSTNRPVENITAVANIATDGRTIERVIVLYTDKSFEAYYLK